MPVYPLENKHPLKSVYLWKISESVEDLQKIQPELVVPSYIHHPNKVKEFLSSRILLSNILPLSGYHKNSDGKPIPVGSGHLSISHTHGWAAVVFDETFSVGIDVEIISEKANRLKTKFSNPVEWEPLKNESEWNDSVLFSVIWSVKEAIYKMLPNMGWVFKENFFINSINKNNGSFSASIFPNKGNTILAKGSFCFIENIVLVVAFQEN